MNTDQALRRVKSILKSLRWGGSGDEVFSRDCVFVTVAPIADYADQLKDVSAFVYAGSAQPDDEIPTLIRQTINVRVLVSVPGDQVGERPLIGANRASATAHGGRGLHPIESQMMAALANVNRSGQFPILLRAAGRVQPQATDSGYHVFREYAFEATLTTAYDHQEPRAVSVSEAGGTVTVSWTAPDDATNLVGYVVRRASGTIPVGFPTDGTDVPWSTGTSTTDTPGAGTWTYSVFAIYDDEGGSYAADHSDYGAATLEVV